MKLKLIALFSAVAVAVTGTSRDASAMICPSSLTWCVDNCPVYTPDWCFTNYSNPNCKIDRGSCSFWFNSCYTWQSQVTCYISPA